MKTKLTAAIIVGIIISSSIVGYFIYLDEPKNGWDCRMKYGKVQQDIQACLDKINNREFFVILQAFA